MSLHVLVSCLLDQVCLAILLQNTSRIFYRNNIINFVFNVYLPAAMSFMAAGGLIFGIKQETRPFLRISDDDVPYDLVGTINSKNFSNLSLPSAWLEEVRNEYNVDYYAQHVRYCMVLLICAMFNAFIEVIWSTKIARRLKQLIPLATTIMLPNDNKEERQNAVVRLMMRKIKDHKSFLVLVFVESLFFLVSSYCLIIDPVDPSSKEHFPVHLNGSEWTVDGSRGVTSQDAHTLIKCPHNQTDFSFEYRSICIVPNDNMYFLLHGGYVLCLAGMAGATFILLMTRIYSLLYRGVDKMNDMVLVRLLRMSVDSKMHEEIIAAFERKLDETRSARLNGTSSVPQTVAVYVRATEKVTLPVGLYDPD